MNKEIIFDEQFRKGIWDLLSEGEYTIQHLKGIVQNEMPISEEYIQQFNYEKSNLVIKLNTIGVRIEKEYKRQLEE